MKRDMELVRKLLLAVEAHENPNEPFDIENAFPDYPLEAVMYHVKLLRNAGLMEAEDASDTKLYYIPEGLTWDGHEFLDAIKNDTVWNQVKEIVREKGASIPLEVLKSLAVGLAEKLFNQ